ncbi:hypothetical protein A0H81_14432 [Grifola frondosa]|uniref:DUF6593 domain-containing protein n=1 Tax=Grifola frondosa TaxID=5627 RepID=A0A1C7LLE6_GRIFR|nr:hypothetical protein A0H81_14432 [Grifola frondosa]
MIIGASDGSDPFSDDHPPSPTETLPDYATEVGVLPPRYAHLERPDTPRIYTFTSWDHNSMYLLPPRDVDRDRVPIYYISVALNLNPFVPLSYVTTIRRGIDEDGEFVGEFELALLHARAIVKIGNQSMRLANVLQKDGHSTRKFRWLHGSIDLRWDCRTTLDDGSPMCICSDSSSRQLASFVPPPIDASPPLPAATLTVFPDGHQHFDHILLSALVVERKMTLAF